MKLTHENNPMMPFINFCYLFFAWQFTLMSYVSIEMITKYVTTGLAWIVSIMGIVNYYYQIKKNRKK